MFKVTDLKPFKPTPRRRYLTHLVSSTLVISSLTLSGCFSFFSPAADGGGNEAATEMAEAETAADSGGDSSSGGSDAALESSESDEAAGQVANTESAAESAPTQVAPTDAPDAEADLAEDAMSESTVAQAITNQQPVGLTATATPLPTATLSIVPTATPQQQANSQAALAPTPEPTPIAMYFQDYGVNPFVNTVDDNQSTFAMDVDTGSYTVMRNYIRDGLLPPEEAVRVEEYVNYFDYDYTMPEQNDVFAIQIDAAKAPFADVIDSNAINSGAEAQNVDVRTVRVGIQGYEISKEERQDVALTFVVDVSGSMGREDRLTLAKRALNMLVEELRPTDSVGIVIYGSAARMVLQPTMASEANKNQIISAIHRLNTEGSTNAEAGLRMGYDSAWSHFNQQANNRVILISDGVANVGATGPNSIWEQIEQYAERGITMTSVGVGRGKYNDVLMEQLADMGDGTYAYVDTIKEARRIFVDDLTGTLQTIAKDAKVQVEFNQDLVAAYRLIGYENRDVADSDFRNDTVDAGEIGAGHSVTALYEVILNQDAANRTELNDDAGQLLTVALRWLDPETDEPTEIAQSLTMDSINASYADSAPDFQLAVAVAEYAEILRGSHWTADGEVSTNLANEIYRIGSLLDSNEKVDEFVALIEQAQRISTGG